MAAPERLTKGLRAAATRTLCLVLILSLLVSACATARPQPAIGVNEVARVSEDDRKRCEEFARAEAAMANGESLGKGFMKGVAKGVTLAPPYSFLLGLAFYGSGFVVMGLTGTGVQAAKNAKTRQAAYDGAQEVCLKPAILEETLGPEHPDVARALLVLADRYAAQGKYAEAEPHYRRALGIEEKVLGPEHADVAQVLEDYAALLRKMNRDAEAEEMETRAKTIRASSTAS